METTTPTSSPAEYPDRSSPVSDAVEVPRNSASAPFASTTRHDSLSSATPTPVCSKTARNRASALRLAEIPFCSVRSTQRVAYVETTPAASNIRILVPWSSRLLPFDDDDRIGSYSMGSRPLTNRNAASAAYWAAASPPAKAARRGEPVNGRVASTTKYIEKTGDFAAMLGSAQIP
ncbi:MAG: hypothetical protein IPF98_19720 [Gemmatimonadetes bacterium]|nr:hypothetical protein [Gemmatimonadota bacterium]